MYLIANGPRLEVLGPGTLAMFAQCVLIVVQFLRLNHSEARTLGVRMQSYHSATNLPQKHTAPARPRQDKSAL